MEEVDIGSLNIKMPRTLHFPDSAGSWEGAPGAVELF